MAIDDDSVVPGDLQPINEAPEWVEHLPLLVRGVKVQAKADGSGSSNFHAKVLDARTRFLKKQAEDLVKEVNDLSLNGIVLIGYLLDEDTLNAIPTEDLAKGTAYFVDFALRVWNGTEWATSGSLRGARGLNILGRWPNTNELPLVEDQELGDAYLWRNDVWVVVPEGWEPLNIRGADGKSAFDVWLEDPANTGKTEDEFFEDIKGPIGKSFLEVWQDQPGNEGKTLDDLMEALKGPQGDVRPAFAVKGTKPTAGDLPRPGVQGDAWYVGIDLYFWVEEDAEYSMIPGVGGKSAFDFWKENGHPQGTMEEFLESMMGGEGILMKGRLDTEDDLLAIDTTDLKLGTSYFVNYAMRVWNGNEWATSGSLRGDRGLNLLGTWPTGVELPEREDHLPGDAYLWRNDIWILLPEPEGWESMNIRGADGKSALEVWQGIEGNEGKTEDQFFESLRGPVGPSPYEEWEALPGNKDKPYSEYLETIRGPEGAPRTPFVVAGSVANTAALPTPGDSAKAYYIDRDLYVWVEADQDYFVIPGLAGKSAFEVYTSIPGNEDKTLGDFWESLRGPKGDNVKGDPGKDGANLNVLGQVANRAALDTLEDVKDQDAYSLADTGHLWIYSTEKGGWVDTGPYRGVDGKSTFDIWKEQPGNEDGTVAQFLAAQKGKDGTSVKILDVFDELSELPTGAADQDTYAVRETRSLYTWLNGAWASLGTFGKDGLDGKDGKSLDIIKILTEEDDAIPAADETNLGKAYVDLDKNVFVNIANRWVNAGKFNGEQGEIGLPGHNLRPKGTIESVNQLPNPALEGVEEGDAYVIADTKLMYVLVDGLWNGPFDFIGPEGKEGPQGTPGALMPIKGTFVSMAALQAAHPTGELGDAYMLIDPTALPEPLRNLAIWSPEQATWIDTGPAGIRGEKGEPGKDSTVPGVKGDKGSQWLILDEVDEPSNTFNGRVGDWCVTRGMRVYYKSPTGWQYWGMLMAGDVNSPLRSLGKVVRWGTEWVALPVDEVEAPVEGVFYARVLKEGSLDETEWGVIEFPKGIEDLLNKDGKQYVRVFAANGETPIWAELDITDQLEGFIKDPEGAAPGTLWLRAPGEKTWVEYKKPPTTAGLQFLQIGGEWKSLDRYDLLIKTANATLTIDPSKEQFVKLDNSGSTAKVVSIGNHTGTRSMVVVLEVVGIAGAISYGGTNIKWDQNTIPSLTGTKNLILFTWDGEVWIGSKGPNLIN